MNLNILWNWRVCGSTDPESNEVGDVSEEQ